MKHRIGIFFSLSVLLRHGHAFDVLHTVHTRRPDESGGAILGLAFRTVVLCTHVRTPKTAAVQHRDRARLAGPSSVRGESSSASTPWDFEDAQNTQLSETRLRMSHTLVKRESELKRIRPALKAPREARHAGDDATIW